MFIVRSAVGRAARQGRDAIRVLDPACGSGAIFVGAYDFLLQRAGRRLTLAQRQTILLEGVFGVDIDAEAVEVAKLSLLLKMLEDTPTATPKEAAICRRKTLAALAANVKCGNALVGPDFFQGRGLSHFRPTKTGLPLRRPGRRTAGNPTFRLERPGGRFRRNPRRRRIRRGRRQSALHRLRADDQPPEADPRVLHADLFRRPGKLGHLLRLRGKGDATLPPRRNGLAVVPNKLASAEYAAGVRRLLAVENRLLSLRDYSAAAIFPVGVYPLVFTVVKERPRPDRATVLCAVSGGAESPVAVPSLFRRAGPAVGTPRRRRRGGGDRKNAGVSAVGLGGDRFGSGHRRRGLSACKSSCESFRGTASPAADRFRVVNSGTIDRYRDLWSEKPLRYLGGSYARPVVAAADLGRLSAKRLAQARTAKIIVAGMTRRLECTVDLEGRVLAAKSTSIVLPRVDARHLLGHPQQQGGLVLFLRGVRRQSACRRLSSHRPAAVAEASHSRPGFFAPRGPAALRAVDEPGRADVGVAGCGESAGTERRLPPSIAASTAWSIGFTG